MVGSVMQTKLLSHDMAYDGSQLNSRFIRESTGLTGDAAVAFIGPADVPTENLVDDEDRDAGAIIKSARMIHFIIQLPGRDLEMAVTMQRLIMACILEQIQSSIKQFADLTVITSGRPWFMRDGDDIYYYLNLDDRRKMSVSIATTSETGVALIHIGINVTGEGAPVPAAGLQDIGLDEHRFARELLNRIMEDATGISHAQNKVRQVG